MKTNNSPKSETQKANIEQACRLLNIAHAEVFRTVGDAPYKPTERASELLMHAVEHLYLEFDM